MESAYPSPQTLLDLARIIWQRRVSVFLFMAAAALVAIFLCLTLTPKYESVMIVAPVNQDARSNQFVEGAYVFAPDVSARIPNEHPEFIRFEQSLRGFAVANLLSKMDKVPDMIEQDTVFQFSTRTINQPEEIAHYLTRAIMIEPIGTTNSRKITYRHPDKDFAVKLLMLLRKTNDQLIRVSAKDDVEMRVEWLRRELDKNFNPEHRTSLANLLMAEERKRMLLSLETPYAVTVIEEAHASARPVAPRPAIIIIILLVVGGVLGSVVALLRHTTSES